TSTIWPIGNNFNGTSKVCRDNYLSFLCVVVQCKRLFAPFRLQVLLLSHRHAENKRRVGTFNCFPVIVTIPACRGELEELMIGLPHVQKVIL
ncbi:hypothetical protein EGW08_006947, partial [Elysia chlorotica]